MDSDLQPEINNAKLKPESIKYPRPQRHSAHLPNNKNKNQVVPFHGVLNTEATSISCLTLCSMRLKMLSGIRVLTQSCGENQLQRFLTYCFIV